MTCVGLTTNGLKKAVTQKKKKRVKTTSEATTVV